MPTSASSAVTLRPVLLLHAGAQFLEFGGDHFLASGKCVAAGSHDLCLDRNAIVEISAADLADEQAVRAYQRVRASGQPARDLFQPVEQQANPGQRIGLRAVQLDLVDDPAVAGEADREDARTSRSNRQVVVAEFPDFHLTRRQGDFLPLVAEPATAPIRPRLGSASRSQGPTAPILSRPVPT